MNIEPKDILTITLSSVSLIASAVNSYVTFHQKTKEDQKGTRKSLTDTLAAMGEINLAMAKLNAEKSSANEAVFGLRRVYNGQRRYLVSHADFFSDQIPNLTTDIDHLFMAQAFDALMDSQRAEAHWQKTIEKSAALSIRATNLRGLARFYFFQGNATQGRQVYQQSLQIQLPDNDPARRLRAETYALWSSTEADFGFVEEAKRQRDLAKSEANRIGQTGMRNEMLAYIDLY